MNWDRRFFDEGEKNTSLEGNDIYLLYWKMKVVCLFLFLLTIKVCEPFETKKVYYENGQLLSSINYREGVRNGAFSYFGAQGQLITKGNYQEGKLADVWTTYYDNGQIKRQGMYKYHVNKTTETQEGKWTSYYENGALASEIFYKDGRRVTWKFFDISGNLEVIDAEGC